MRSPYMSYRPLRCGVAITSAGVGQYGTLGFFGKSADGAAWLVSCYHVLCRVDFSAYAPGEAVFQPEPGAEPQPVARTADRADKALDCAAARLEAGVVGRNEVLSLGAFAPTAAAAAVGMRVFKFGAITELTEGVIVSATAAEIVIDAEPSFPAAYELSKVGDSGSLWFEQGTFRPVGLHREGERGGRRVKASPVGAVLTALGLSFL